MGRVVVGRYCSSLRRGDPMPASAAADDAEPCSAPASLPVCPESAATASSSRPLAARATKAVLKRLRRGGGAMGVVIMMSAGALRQTCKKGLCTGARTRQGLCLWQVLVCRATGMMTSHTACAGMSIFTLCCI